MLTRTIAMCVVAAAAALGACGGASGPSTAPAAPTASTAPASTGTVPAACTLFTQQDAATLLGSSQVKQDATSTATNCTYDLLTGPAAQPLMGTAALVVDHYPSAEQARTYYSQTRTLHAGMGQAQDLSGVGDAAQVYALGVVVLKGQFMLQISAGPAAQPSAAAYRAAADAVLRRLG